MSTIKACGMPLLLVISLFASHTYYWKQIDNRQDYLIVDKINHAPEKVCGSVQLGEAWEYRTFKAAGAKRSVSGTTISQEDAKRIVEAVCR